MTLTNAENEYLSTQRIGRLATVSPDGSPQVNPVGFRYDAERGVIDISGYNMSATKKFRNVAAGSRVSFVVDDIASVDPWRVRGIEFRGDAEALSGHGEHREQAARSPGRSGEIIRIHPRRVFSWGVDPGVPGMRVRDVTSDVTEASTA